MKISYAITVCNEYKELDKLLKFLFQHKREVDEVVVQKDKSNVTDQVWIGYSKSMQMKYLMNI